MTMPEEVVVKNC